MLTLASSEASEGGRLTKQFCRCTREISAAVDCAFLRGAISAHAGPETGLCVTLCGVLRVLRCMVYGAGFKTSNQSIQMEDKASHLHFLHLLVALVVGALPPSAARMAAAASRQFACAEARGSSPERQGAAPANQARLRQERRGEAPNWSQLSLRAPARRSMFNYPWPKTREKARLHASGRVPLSGAQPSLPDPSQRLCFLIASASRRREPQSAAQPTSTQLQSPVPRRGQQHHTATMALLQMKAPVDYQVQLSEY